MCVCVRACVRVCVRARVRKCVRACVHVGVGGGADNSSARIQSVYSKVGCERHGCMYVGVGVGADWTPLPKPTMRVRTGKGKVTPEMTPRQTKSEGFEEVRSAGQFILLHYSPSPGSIRSSKPNLLSILSRC